MKADEVALPALSDERVEEMEDAVFARIASERAGDLARVERARQLAVRRGRWWMGGAAAAALIAVAAVIAPHVLPGIQGSTETAGSAAVAPASAPDIAGSGVTETSGGARDSAGPETAESDALREIAVTASAAVEVDDAATAAVAIGEAAVAAGGYVETMSIGSSSAIDPAAVVPEIYPPLLTGTWITVRVPSDQLTATLSGLSEWGKVTSSQVDRRDVTTEAVDLRARVTALEGSVARLTELMAQSASTADLITAESALSARQSELDSLRQQLTWLEGQVDMSSATITLTEPAPAVAADPAGFGDGLTAGWNGLVATVNGIVVAIGFLLPWLAVAALAGFVIWAVRRAIRARRSLAAGSSPVDN
ncbi:DUF4349 domain-containing protein [Microbacterium sp.]|uniref:DUF4349 domain-containing protein n=1 Tax=Microbacterium sp. TaxID=51671 RepID=UPI0025F80BA5|nr:DUF4349 domain-containing protein [Microbacterium sp.]